MYTSARRRKNRGVWLGVLGVSGLVFGLVLVGLCHAAPPEAGPAPTPGATIEGATSASTPPPAQPAEAPQAQVQTVSPASPSPDASLAPVAAVPTLPGSHTPSPAPASRLSPDITRAALQKEAFSFYPKELKDPFAPFFTPSEPSTPQTTQGKSEDDIALEPEMQKPLTPLQKMSLGEIESGLKAIIWGDLGRKAVIEDSARKGYIVTVGTPVGEKNGVITEIFNDKLVIQQEVWDKNLKKMVAQNSVVKLQKAITK